MKATSGGKFDPNAGLMYFVAGDVRRASGTGPDHVATDQWPAIPGHPNVLVAVNELNAPGDLDALDRLCDTRNVLLDSGIFNLAMNHARAHDTTHDVGLSLPPEEIDGFDKLWDRYGSVVTRFADRVWGLIELDQGGVEHKPRTRARIETEFGVTPMPVYHPLLDGWDYYDTLAGEYDRICHGNLVKASVPVRLRLIHAASERARAYPGLWTHLLGVTPNENLIGLPLRGSCDSSSWLVASRWPATAWNTSSMLKLASLYPSTMWATAGYGKRIEAIEAICAGSTQRTLAALSEDTHPWLSPSPL